MKQRNLFKTTKSIQKQEIRGQDFRASDACQMKVWTVAV